MDQDNDPILRNLSPIEPPAALPAAILGRVGRLQRRALLRRRLIAVGADLLSAAAFIGATVTLVRSFRLSGFGTYLSLLVTDGRLVLSFWSQYFYSLSESLPVTGIIIFLASLLALLWSIRYTSRFFNGRHISARPV